MVGDKMHIDIDGACQCGQVMYVAKVQAQDVTICHCNDCQRLTGAAYRVTVTASRENFRLTSGHPTLYVKTAANGRRRMQYFCSNCGSPIYTSGEHEDANQVGIRLGTITQRQISDHAHSFGAQRSSLGLKIFAPYLDTAVIKSEVYTCEQGTVG